ncbi:MAG: AAA family ATPase [Abditibacteriales bacterium]|nr:AAA family ATPase [Abditibacteriales bacterium]MDW8364808.1 AAA family ATPase [Abditibacteriales bacterium]
MITRLILRNFKSLRKVDVRPQAVNLVIGANGSGKSNFADAFQFIAQACHLGLKEALDNLGGLEEVRTRKAGAGKPPQLHVGIELGKDASRGLYRGRYEFTLSQSKHLEVDTEQLDAEVFPFTPGKPRVQGVPRFKTNARLRLAFTRRRSTIAAWTEDTLGARPMEADDPQQLLLHAYGRVGQLRTVANYLGAMRVYNIDAPLAKHTLNSGEGELARNGANLIGFVRRALADEPTAHRLMDRLRDAVPYIERIVPDRILSMPTLRFHERDTGLDFFATQVSDGTLRLLGLLAVFLQPAPPPVVVVEEPENALHAEALKEFLRSIGSVSQEEQFPTQTFLTSHSPVIADVVLGLDYQAQVKTTCFVARRREGGATVEEAAPHVMAAIRKNLGRPSDFLREGALGEGLRQTKVCDLSEARKRNSSLVTFLEGIA